MANNINFTQNFEPIVDGDDESRISCEFLLEVNSTVFDPEENSENSLKMRDYLFDRYFNYFSGLCPDGHIVIVRLGGLHVELIELIKNYTYTEESRNQVIFHYHHWRSDINSEAVDEDSYMIIRCNRPLFKKLFRDYWFSIDVEYRFEGLIIKPEHSSCLNKWLLIDAQDENRMDLIRKAYMVFDNLHNGFHFRICSQKENIENGVTP